MSYCLKLLFDDEHGGDRDIRWWQIRMKKLDNHYGSLISTGKDATDLIRRQCKAYEPMLMRSQSSKIFILLIMICCREHAHLVASITAVL
ncbi:unnamed protein product [Cuscuta campestris]|uniref:Uncharacterized protein n=1 Tax=Cuscuta campestris TaxID=132261 RepID=A0A484KUX3_9ASTE|nr:unnamed protein product [Cuscuta campestris]